MTAEESKTISRWVQDLARRAASAREAVGREKKQLEEAAESLADIEEAQKIVQLVAATVQEQAHQRISSVVSRCLESVFDEPYSFKIRFEQKRGQTEAVLFFERDGMEVNPLRASGGGVVDIAAFALRLACVLLNRPNLRPVLILDEPFRFVSEEYRPRVVAMLHSLVKELGVQIVMVTHIEELKTGNIIEL